MRSITIYINLVVLIVVISIVGGCEMGPEKLKPQEIHLTVKPFCSETKLRTGVASLTWRTNKDLFEKQRVDMTAYKRGFEKGLYTTMWPLKKGGRFQESGSSKLPDRASSQSLFLEVIEMNFDRERGTTSMKVEGLEAGLNYFWRVLTLYDGKWVPSDIVSCEAPVCPADIEENQDIRQGE